MATSACLRNASRLDPAQRRRPVGYDRAMSNLDDPRVLFAAERTLMAWSRTAAGLMAFGFVIDRTAMLVPRAGASAAFALWIGLAFVLLGVALSLLSIVQYRRSVATLRPVEIPPRYWVNLSVYVSALIGLLGLTLAAYLTLG
jgi:putative membrane protein